MLWSSRVGVVFSVVLAASTVLGEQFTVEYTFDRPAIEAVRLGGQDYQRIILPGSPSGGSVGAPRLPARGTSILVPYGQELVGVEIISGEQILLGRGVFVEPVCAGGPLSGVPRQPEPPRPDAAIYASDQPYPASRSVNVGVQRFRGYPLLILRLQPVEYIPTTGELYYYPRLQVVVETRAAGRGEALLRGLEDDRREVLRRADNPAAAWSYPAGPRGGRSYGLLIITTPELAASFAPLKAFHDSHGLPTEIRTTAEIGGAAPDLLRAYITSEYAANGIEYVLIGGDDDLLPAKDLYVFAPTYPSTSPLIVEDMPADFYYGCLDGTFNYDGDDRWGEPTDGEGEGDVDLVAEVYVGRAPVDDAQDVARFVNKTLQYLSNDHSHLDRVLLAGEFLGFGGPTEYSDVCLEELVDTCDAHGYTNVGFPSERLSIDRLNDRPSSAEDCTEPWTWSYGKCLWPASELIDRVNDGVHIINHIGHGHAHWALKLANDDLSLLTNEDPFFVYSQACHAGEFDWAVPCEDPECWAEHAVVKSDHAAFAAIMNARWGWGGDWTTDGASQHLNREFWDAVYSTDEAKPELGRANADSKEDNIYRLDETLMRLCMYGLNLLGDPSVRLLDCSNAGSITLDRASYKCQSTVTITIGDCGSNTNDNVVETVTINIQSTSQPAGRSVVLTETRANSARFMGSVNLGSTGSNVLHVAQGDIVTATYIDADDGQGGTNVPVVAQAQVDCTPPVLSNVHVTDIGPHSAVVAFTANEPVQATVRYGPDCTTRFFTLSSGGYSTPVQIPLTGFSEGTTYFFTVEARDEAGNLTVDPICHSFDTAAVPDFLTELFTTNNDLDYTGLTFIPNNSVSFYHGCSTSITSLPTDPAGGTSLTFTNNDDGYAQISLSGGATVSLYGVSYNGFYVGTNGYITFVAPDTNPLESLEDHFDQPRISGLFHNLVTGSGGTVKWKQLSDRVAVTYNNVREFGSTNRSTFQIELYFDGRIVLSYLAVGVTDGLVGLSKGLGVSPDYLATDLSVMGSCVPTPPVAYDGALSLGQGGNAPITLRASDDGLPNPPGALTYILTSLPVHGTLSDPGAGPISTVPYALVGGGNQMEYVPEPLYVGPDSFAFYVHDGGVPPEGGDSDLATISLSVQPLPALIYRFPMDSDPGWTTTGQWAFGHPVGGGSHAKDPHLGQTGLNVYGYDLAGDYANDLLVAECLTTGAIDCLGLHGVELRFWRWLGVDGVDHADIEVSNDGVTWAAVWANVGIHNESSWTPQVYDISETADEQSTIYIRWSIGPTNGSITYPGWNIDDVEIWGIPTAGPVGDVNCDGILSLADIPPFVEALTDAEGFPAEHPACDIARADCSGDGVVDGRDIQAFIELLTADRRNRDSTITS
jgi:hypothetical protein